MLCGWSMPSWSPSVSTSTQRRTKSATSHRTPHRSLEIRRHAPTIVAALRRGRYLTGQRGPHRAAHRRLPILPPHLCHFFLSDTEQSHFIDLARSSVEKIEPSWVADVKKQKNTTGCVSLSTLTDTKGNTPLHTALLGMNNGGGALEDAVKKVITDLVKFGGKECVGKKNGDGMTALHMLCGECPPTGYDASAVESYVAVLAVLLDHGAVVEEKDTATQSNALHHAVIGAGGAFIEVLLRHIDHNDIVNAVDEDGLTALQLASCSGNIEAVRALLPFPQLDVNYVGQGGESAVALAYRNGHRGAVDALLQHGGARREDLDAVAAAMKAEKEKQQQQQRTETSGGDSSGRGNVRDSNLRDSH